MNSKTRISVLIVTLSMVTAAILPAASPSPDDLADTLRRRIEAGDEAAFDVGDSRIYCIKTLKDFYERRTFRPAWWGRKGSTSSARVLIEELKNAGTHGLQPADYHYAAIEEKLKRSARIVNSESAIDIDLLLTDAFLLYASHLLSGQVNPETIDSEWFANRRGADMAMVLQNALDNDTVAESLEILVPPQPGYSFLREALTRYRRNAKEGGWEAVAEGAVMKRGDTGARILALRRRLLRTDDLTGTAVDSTFDEELERGVIHFQKRHGLDVDGVVGPVTLAALNITVHQRIRQIMINMERWRWLPQNLGKRHVIVNIANFQLDAIDGEDRYASMRVIVGRDYRRTPVFSDEISYLVFNPLWEVPRLIAVEDILPQIKKDAAYVQRMGFDVLRGWGSEEKPVNPAHVDWTTLSKNNFPYRLRQRPGVNNALGRVKFMFPNKFDVYIHDTSARDLFARTERILSSGCIRVEKPLELAVFLFDDSAEWQRDAIQAAMMNDNTRTVRLSNSVPIHMLYWTCWADPSGTMNFRRDIYGRDARLEAALKQDPPEAD